MELPTWEEYDEMLECKDYLSDLYRQMRTEILELRAIRFNLVQRNEKLFSALDDAEKEIDVLQKEATKKEEKCFLACQQLKEERNKILEELSEKVDALEDECVLLKQELANTEEARKVLGSVDYQEDVEHHG